MLSCVKSLHLLKLSRRKLLHCFAVKLQKCFVEYETSPDFPSAWGRLEKDWKLSPLRLWACLWSVFLSYGFWWHYLNRWSPDWYQELWTFSWNISSVQFQNLDRKVLFSMKIKMWDWLKELQPQNHSPGVYKLHLLTWGSSHGHPLLSRHPGSSPVVHQNNGWILQPTGCHQSLSTGKSC